MAKAAGEPAEKSTDLAGSLPFFPRAAGSSLAGSLELVDFRRKRLLLNRLSRPGQVHVYSAECRAGERLRLQLLVPMLPLGGSVAPSVAVIAQSLPYSADVQKLPMDLPAGFSAVVAPPPGHLVAPAQDRFTGARYYPGPVIDTRTLVGGRCYIVVWSPYNHMGKYALHIGYAWPWQWAYWLQLLRFWWQVRGWFEMSRTAAYVAVLAVVLAIVLILRSSRSRRRRP